MLAFRLIVTLACLWTTSASASDVQATAPVRLAAIGSPSSPSAQHRPQRPIDVLQLVQAQAPNGIEGLASEDLIIVAVDASKPESLDEEIAREHKLEIVGRLVMSSVGLRVISYRPADAQPTDKLIERLRADSRITSAQENVAYQAIAPATTPDRLTSVKPPETRSGKVEHGTRRKSAVPGESGGTAAPSIASKPETPVRPSRRPSVQVGRLVAADVLAGGL